MWRRRCLGKVKVTHSASGYHTQDTKTRKEKEKKHPVRGEGKCLVSSVWFLWEPRRAELLQAVWAERIDGSSNWKWALMINLLSVISWLVFSVEHKRNLTFKWVQRMHVPAKLQLALLDSMKCFSVTCKYTNKGSVVTTLFSKKSWWKDSKSETDTASLETASREGQTETSQS